MRELLRVSHLATGGDGGAPLRDLNLTVFAGETVFLVGVHGSGKHALPLVLSGRLPATGRIYVEEREIFNPGIHSLSTLGVVCVDSLRSLAGSLTVSENLFVLRPARQGRLFYHKKYADLETARILTEYGLHRSPRDLVKDLNPLEQYLLCIAKAISQGAKLLVLNCVGLSFSLREYDVLRAEFRRLKEKGLSFLLLDNIPNPLIEEADRAVVIYEGRDLKVLRRAELHFDSLEDYLIRLPLGGQWDPDPAAAETKESGGCVLSGDGFLPIRIPSGKLIGLFELHQTIDAPFSKYFAVAVKSNRLSIRLETGGAVNWSRAAILPEESGERLCPNLSLGDNLLLPAYPRVTSAVVQVDMGRHVARSFCSELGRKEECIRVDELDRCERKLLCIRRWCLAKAEAIVLENPDFGLDLLDRERMIRMLREISAAGVPVIITSHNAFILRSCCSSVLLADDGKIRKVLSGAALADPEAWARGDSP